MKKKQRTCNVRSILFHAIPVVLTAVFLFSTGMFVRDWLSYKEADDEYASLDSLLTRSAEENVPARESMESAEGAESGTDGFAERYSFSYVPLSPDLEALAQKNADFVGVIDIPVLGIHYPVVKSHDNDEYLRTTFEGTKNAAGCIFLDQNASEKLTDVNTFVYGHNMKNGSMFGKLKEFRSSEMVDRFPYVFLHTFGGVKRYRIFSCSEVRADSSIYRGISGDDEYDRYVENAVTRSTYRMPEDGEVDFTRRPPLLSLSTCTGTSHDLRYVVQCALVE